VNVIYSLDDFNRLSINFKALATKATPINLTNHVYFNLGKKRVRHLWPSNNNNDLAQYKLMPC